MKPVFRLFVTIFGKTGGRFAIVRKENKIMLNNEVWTNRYVKFIDEISHKRDSKHFPPVNTLGLVVIDDGDSILVQWERNRTSGDDMWWCFKEDVELMPETTAENVLRYGLVITDDMMFTDNADWAGHIRVRLINYCGNLYYHKMIDGKIIDFKVVGKANA